MKVINLFLGSPLLFLGAIILQSSAHAQRCGQHVLVEDEQHANDARMYDLHLSWVQETPALNKTTSPEPRRLQVTETLETQLTGLITDRVRCDENDNIYLHPYANEAVKAHTVGQSPIQKIKADGSLGETFRSTDAGQYIEGRDFFVTGDGRIYQAAMAPTRVKHGYTNMPCVLEFSSDGSFKSKIELDMGYFYPYQIAVFKSGELLLSGMDKDQIAPVIAVFDSGGKLIKKVSLPERILTEAARVSANSAVSHGEITAGSDGNMYLMRSSSPAVIYVISPTGDIVRTLQIGPADPQWVAISIVSAPERLAVAFYRPAMHNTMLIRVTDLEGNEIATYQSEDSRIQASYLGCYVPPRFQFFSARYPGTGFLYSAEPR